MTATRAPTAVRVLVVDDERAMAEMLAEGLGEHGFEAAAATSGEDAKRRLDSESFDAVVTDLRMQPVDGVAVLEHARALDADRPVLVMTAFGAVDSAVECIRRGAFHYFVKPFKLDELVIFLRRALSERSLRREAVSLRRALRAQPPPGLVAESPAMQNILDVIHRVADSATPVLLLGETGTGKTVLARAVHDRSARASGPFIAVNCAALPEQLLESELFGHVKGAFSGATGPRAGLFADADGGTLLLDEVGDLALPLQAKLLHVLEHGGVRPVGATRERMVDVRVVAATNRDLKTLVTKGQFREDLLYRLDVVSVEVPALRERGEDIPTLADLFLSSARTRHPRSVATRLAPDVYRMFLAYRWPGNVRELAHVIERMVVLATAETLSATDVPASIRETAPAEGMSFGADVVPARELLRRYATWALEQCGGHRARTAERLAIDPKTLNRWLASDETEPSST